MWPEACTCIKLRSYNKCSGLGSFEKHRLNCEIGPSYKDDGRGPFVPMTTRSIIFSHGFLSAPVFAGTRAHFPEGLREFGRSRKSLFRERKLIDKNL